MSKIFLDDLYGVVDSALLKGYLGPYVNFNDKVLRLIKSEELIPLMRGKYIVNAIYQSGGLSKYQIGNALYGPSYVSFFTALAYHGMIPERVHLIESATILRSKKIDTQVGSFRYQKVAEKTFHLGLDYYQEDKIAYLIATPTKAIIDILWTEKVSDISGVNKLYEYLCGNLRIDEEELIKLDLELVAECKNLGKRNRLLGLLERLLTSLKKDYN